MDRTVKEELIQRLEELHAWVWVPDRPRPSDVFDKHSSICSVIYNWKPWNAGDHEEDAAQKMEALNLIKEAFINWSEVSGDINFPVPSDDYEEPEDAYIFIFDLWEGEYGARRKRLLAFTILFLRSHK